MIRKFFVVLALATAVLMPLQAAEAKGPPGHWKHGPHHYVYYPVREIYYEPTSSQWFWLDGGNWRAGTYLPVSYRRYATGGVRVVLESPRPYYHHDYVVHRYGRGPRVIERHHHDRRPVVVEHHHYHGKPRQVHDRRQDRDHKRDSQRHGHRHRD